MVELELNDMQGLLRHGYPNCSEAAYLLLSIRDAAAARSWLRTLAAERRVDSALTRRDRYWTTWGRAVPAHLRCSIVLAFSASGLRALGVSDPDMRTFAAEFQQGMAAPHRARLLGDEGANAPAGWDWGGPNHRVDILMIIYATSVDYDACVDHFRRSAVGVTEVSCVHGRLRPREPFGFMDGISQPPVEGLTGKDALPGERLVRAGEFVLGYQNEFGRYPASPSLTVADPEAVDLPQQSDGRVDLGRNGSFLVLRQLQQEVDAFNDFLARAAAAIAGQPGLPASDQAALAEWIGAKMVGRWRSGAPLVRYPHDVAQMELEQLEAGNDFGFHREDRHGFLCPIGAHIRRANPRDSLADAMGVAPAEAQAMVDQHRLLRRGRRYRKGGQRGLMFLCLNANIERQFEFVQNSWVLHPEFGGLHGESDPLLGAPPRCLSLQRPTVSRRIDSLEQFVTVKGGEYFFLPGLKALDYLLRP